VASSAARRQTPIYTGTRIPAPIPSVLKVDPALREDDDILEVNFGPNHPSTHGVLRLIVELNGERVEGVEAVIGYLHTGFEKNMEQKTWWKAITYPERIDYLSFQINELAFVLAIEKLLGVEPPPKATWMRTLLSELSRIHSHLIWLGTGALELGAISLLWYCFRERDAVLDLFELVTGVRMHTRYFQAGGLAEDLSLKHI
jgi:NADH-quinone oxidoreductase subunit D